VWWLKKSRGDADTILGWFAFETGVKMEKGVVDFFNSVV
jgi:hypothetical protein